MRARKVETETRPARCNQSPVDSFQQVTLPVSGSKGPKSRVLTESQLVEKGGAWVLTCSSSTFSGVFLTCPLPVILPSSLVLPRAACRPISEDYVPYTFQAPASSALRTSPLCLLQSSVPALHTAVLGHLLFSLHLSPFQLL
jgi:hypothetical protein